MAARQLDLDLKASTPPAPDARTQVTHSAKPYKDEQ